MKGKKFSAQLMLLVTIIACSLAMPVIPSEHPWDVDTPKGGGGGGGWIHPPTGSTDSSKIDSTTNQGGTGQSSGGQSGRIAPSDTRVTMTTRLMVRLAIELSRFLSVHSPKQESRMQY